MSTQIQIKQEELSQIKQLQSKFQSSIMKMGQLQVEKMELDKAVNDFLENEKKLKEEWISLQKEEQAILDNIIKTYGEGSLDMTNGTFIPTPQK